MKDMSKREGFVKMRFVGKPEGILMKGAPGNYEHGKIYDQPFDMSQWKFWELIEKPPEIIAPPLSDDDNVFEEPMFVPDEEQVAIPEIGVELTASAPVNNELNIDPDTPASIEPYASFNTGTGQLTDIDPESFSQSEPVLLTTPFNIPPLGEEKEYTRDELLEILKKAGVEVKPRTRITTLLKMVENLDTQKDD